MNTSKKLGIVAGVVGLIAVADAMKAPTLGELNKKHGIVSAPEIQKFQNLVAQDVASKLCKEPLGTKLDMPNPFNENLYFDGDYMFDADIQKEHDEQIHDLQSNIREPNIYNKNSHTYDQLQNGEHQTIVDNLYYGDKNSYEIRSFANHYDKQINTRVQELLNDESNFCETDFDTLFKKK